MNTMRLSVLIGLSLFCGSAAANAGCEGGMMGATNEDPLLSSVDITFSPIYSSATTSGTSNCPNWDIALWEKRARFEFLVANREFLQEEISQGAGPHTSALAALYRCSSLGQLQFSAFLRLHQQRINYHLRPEAQPEALVPELSEWIQLHPSLRHECATS